MDFIGYIVALAIGYAIGYISLAIKLRELIEEYALAEDISEKENTVVKLKTELLHGTLFLYDNTDNFVCQGDTLAELAKLANEIKHIKYASVLHGDTIVVFINGEVTDCV